MTGNKVECKTQSRVGGVHGAQANLVDKPQVGPSGEQQTAMS